MNWSLGRNSVRAATLVVVAWASTAVVPTHARAGVKVSWLDDVVRQVVRDAEAEAPAAARVARRPGATAGKLFAREADEGLEVLAKRSEDLARAARRVDRPAEAVLDRKFAQLVRSEPEAARTFRALEPAEKRLVVEMGETAQRLARRHPGDAETLIRKLGVDGLTAVRVYGDDVAEVVAKEGPESLNVLRKTGRGGWAFFNEKVLPHKGKLAAAGVLALFLSDPDRFVDTAGRATRYAAEQFARAGVQLAGYAGDGVARGVQTALGRSLSAYGLDSPLARNVGMVVAILVAVVAGLVLLGLPLRPLTWPLRRLFRRRAA